MRFGAIRDYYWRSDQDPLISIKWPITKRLVIACLGNKCKTHRWPRSTGCDVRRSKGHKVQNHVPLLYMTSLLAFCEGNSHSTVDGQGKGLAMLSFVASLNKPFNKLSSWSVIADVLKLMWGHCKSPRKFYAIWEDVAYARSSPVS